MGSSFESREEIIAFTQELVRVNSLPGEEGAVAKLVEAKLRTLDYDSVVVDENGSVVAARQGARPGKRVLFDAHMDVVPVQNPESWSRDPFGGELVDGKIFGRGATDIKGGLAAAAIALGRLPRESFSGTLIVSASVGEELIEGGSLQLVIEQNHPDGVVIVEPTECKLGTGHKGRTGFWIQVSGKPAHTSRPELGDNAIYKAVRIVEDLRAMPLPEDGELGPGVQELIEIRSMPFPGECTVPYGCTLRYDRRLVQSETPETVLASVEKALPIGLSGWKMDFNESVYSTCTGKVIRRREFHPGWVIAAGSDWVRKSAEGIASANLPVELANLPYCTNGSYSAGVLGLPTVVFGPSTVRLAHVIDEYIEVDELLRGAEGLAGLAMKLGE